MPGATGLDRRRQERACGFAVGPRREADALRPGSGKVRPYPLFGETWILASKFAEI